MTNIKAKVFFINGIIETKTEMTSTELTNMLDDLGFEIMCRISPFPSEEVQESLNKLAEEAKNNPAIDVENLDEYLDSLTETEDE